METKQYLAMELRKKSDLLVLVKEAALELRAFDITEDKDAQAVPAWVDVPDDYEGGVNDAGARILAILDGTS